MLVYFLFLFFCLLTVHIFIRKKRFGRMVSKIPGPPTLPFIGNLRQLFGTAEHLWYKLHEIADKYYPISKIWLSISAIVIIRDPDDLEVLLTSKVFLDKGEIYTSLESWFQNGVLMSRGEKWQQRRRLLISTFHLDNLKKYVEVTSKCTDTMIKKVKSGGKEVCQDISLLCYKLLLKAFCDASLNVDIEKFNNNIIDNYKKSMDELFRISIYRIVRPYIMNWMMPFLSIGKKEKESLKNIFKLRDELIRDRRKFHEKTNNQFLKESIDCDKEILSERKKKLAMLDRLLLAEKEGFIDEKGINEEVDDMIAAGHETAATEMIYIIMLLAENKEAQSLARKEVIDVLTESNGKLTLLELQKLEYTDRCIKEALRLYPAAPLFLRHLKEDLHLKNNTVPAGIDVMCMISATHRDPKFWPDPMKFDPDRFLPANVEKRHPYAYLPFSAGPRNCLGQKLAIIQMRIMTAKILYNFFLEPIDYTANLRFNASITLHPTKPVFTKFISIDK